MIKQSKLHFVPHWLACVKLLACHRRQKELQEVSNSLKTPQRDQVPLIIPSINHEIWGISCSFIRLKTSRKKYITERKKYITERAQLVLNLCNGNIHQVFDLGFACCFYFSLALNPGNLSLKARGQTEGERYCLGRAELRNLCLICLNGNSKMS